MKRADVYFSFNLLPTDWHDTVFVQPQPQCGTLVQFLGVLVNLEETEQF